MDIYSNFPIQKHFACRDEKNAKRDFCFISIFVYGGVRESELVTIRLIDIKNLCQIANLHPHLLRAYFCSNALHNAGYSIDQVANQAGHSSLNTTKGYIMTEQEDIISLANKL